MKRLDPYRLLFPIGLTYGILGAGLWPLHSLGILEYPGIAHRRLMIQGFEQCFVLGFLLTAMPGITKGPPCHPLELVVGSTWSPTRGSHSAWSCRSCWDLAVCWSPPSPG